MKKTQRFFWNNYYRLHSGWRKSTIFSNDETKILENKVVLEVGCGNGKTIQGLLNSNVKKIFAIDFSEIAVRHSAKKFSQEISSGFLDIKQMDSTLLDFPDNFFGVVVCYHTLGAQLLAERKKTVSEFERVLKPNGFVLFEDFALGDLRQKNSFELVEENTVKKNNGIIQHFFEEKEVVDLFSNFKIIKLSLVEDYLRLGKKKVCRRELKGIFVKH